MRILILLMIAYLAKRVLRKFTWMWVVGALYVYAALYIDAFYARGTLEWFMFAALWLPIRLRKTPNAIYAGSALPEPIL